MRERRLFVAGAPAKALRLDRYRPIEVTDLADRILRCAERRGPLGAVPPS